MLHLQNSRITMPQAPFFVPDTSVAEINPVVAPLQAESVVVKNYPNSFLKTDLKEILDKQGVEEVVVIGAMSHMCIEATSRAASDFGYQVTVVHDACATCNLQPATCNLRPGVQWCSNTGGASSRHRHGRFGLRL